MKILALDSSGLVASVAVVSDDNLIGEYTINYKKTHSQTLLPMLDEVAKMTELDLKTIDFIAVSAGPGSFTGLRIGSATAKGLAMALDKQIVSVPTVDALAYNLWGSADVVCPLMDARRQQTYTGLYDFTDGRMNTILPQCVVMIEEIVDQINELGRRVIFLGDGVDVFRDYINEHVKVDYDFAPAMCNKQRASAVACLGQVLYEHGRAENAADHKPEYLRLSQAERERQERREILEYDNKTHGAGGCRLGGADRKRQLHTALEQTGIFGCHEASGEYRACGTGGWRDTGVSVHICVI